MSRTSNTNLRSAAPVARRGGTLIIALTLLAACTGRKNTSTIPSGPGPLPKPDRSCGTERALSHPRLTGGGGAVVEHQRSKDMIKLVVHYTWGGTGRREAHVSKAENVFQILFSDLPKADETGSVEFECHYRALLTDQQKTALNNKAADVVGTLVTEIKAAADRSEKDPIAHALSQEVVKQAFAKFADYRGEGDTPGDRLLANTMGLQMDDKGQLKATLEFQAFIQQHASNLLLLSPNADAPKWLINLPKWSEKWSESAIANCRNKALSALSQEPNDSDQIVATVAKCFREQAEFLRTVIKDSGATNPDQSKLTGLVNAFLGEPELNAEVTLEAVTEGGGPVKGLFTKMEALRREMNKVEAVKRALETEATKQGRIAFTLAVNLLREAAKKRQRESAAKALKTQLTKKITFKAEVLKTTTTSTSALMGESEKRWYDTSTGVVWIGIKGLDDVVMPIFVSVCPIDGCLRKKKVFYSSPWSFAHSWSVDLGVMAAVLDNKDKRHRPGKGFLFGISWNPVQLFRVSWGGYSFENQLTGHWETSMYVGVTVNVLQAMELLGVLGLGTPQAPKFDFTPAPAKGK